MGRRPSAVFGFEVQGATFSPAEESVARVSLAWWEKGLDDPTPLFSGTRERPVTRVAVWPTGPRGLLLPERIEQVDVRIWEMTAETFADLRALHERFHLGWHDLWVSGGERVRVRPCARSLIRLAKQRKPNLARRLERGVQLLL